MKFCWFILGNGRRGYIERTIASWEANLLHIPEFKIIFDDSGDLMHVAWLEKHFGDRFRIVPIARRSMGQKFSLDFIFTYIQRLDVEYILQVEEDWMLNRPLDILQIAKVLERNPKILQMRIPRVVWHSSYHNLDIKAGSQLLYHLNMPLTTSARKAEGKDCWYEWRGEFYFWTHNPNVFNKKILTEDYASVPARTHELSFGMKLLSKFPTATSGFWASNPYEGYVTHIGFRDKKLLRKLHTLSN
jgi:hypothetical protein